MPWYEYSSRPGGGLPLPQVEIRLLHGARWVRVVALVDSGADVSLMDASYASVLGLDRADAEIRTAMGAGGDGVDCLVWPNATLEMQFEAERFAFKGAFVDFPPGADGINLVGRRDFFRKFVVQFWEDKRIMNIDLSPDFPFPAVS